MKTPAAAILWSMWGRYRRSLLAIAAGLLALAALAPLTPAWLRSGPGVLVLALPGIGVFGFLMSAALCSDGQFGAMSGLPPRLFTLPVRTATLVAWPMLSGAAVVALVWVAAAELIFRPGGFRPPTAGGALVLAALTAWLQALSWTPFRAPWARVVAAAAVLSALVAAFLWAVEIARAPRYALGLILVGYLAAAAVVAFVGVARDRRGDGRDGVAWLRLGGLAERRPRDRRPFASAAQAQRWLEWRQMGLALPIWMAMILVADVVFLAATDPLPLDKFRRFFGVTLLLPPLMAGTVGLQGTKLGKDLRLPVSLATRPMTSGALVAAKLEAAALSVLAAWALVVAVRIPALWLTGNGPNLAQLCGELQARFPGVRAVGVALLGVVALLAITWTNLVSALAICLTGRDWLVQLAAWAFSILMMAFTGTGLWLAFHPESLDTALVAATWVAGGLVVAKGLAAGWALRTSVRRRFLSARAAWGAIALWLAVAACLVALVLEGWHPGRRMVPPILLGIALNLPLTRLAAAPLALAWNRHR
jgi:hypothetical protein